MQIQFDLQSLELQDGWYEAEVLSAVMGESKAGDPMLKVREGVILPDGVEPVYTYHLFKRDGDKIVPYNRNFGKTYQRFLRSIGFGSGTLTFTVEEDGTIPEFVTARHKVRVKNKVNRLTGSEEPTIVDYDLA